MCVWCVCRYTFYLDVDDSARLWVDDTMIIDKWTVFQAHTHTHREREKERERAHSNKVFTCVCLCVGFVCNVLMGSVR